MLHLLLGWASRTIRLDHITAEGQTRSNNDFGRGHELSIKEQLLMRSLGLGWNEAYHAWSKDGIPYTSYQLF